MRGYHCHGENVGMKSVLLPWRQILFTVSMEANRVYCFIDYTVTMTLFLSGLHICHNFSVTIVSLKIWPLCENHTVAMVKLHLGTMATVC